MSGVHFDIDQEVVFVGRSPGNDVRIPDEAVSRRHLKIFSVESCYFIEDLKTKNGTLINGEALDAGFAQGGSTLIFQTDAAKRNFALVGAGVMARLKKNLYAQANYHAEIGRGGSNIQTVNAGLRWEF